MNIFKKCDDVNICLYDVWINEVNLKEIDIVNFNESIRRNINWMWL